jgi:hypothetical protein
MEMMAPSGKVLDCDAEGKRHSRGRCNEAVARQIPCIDNPDGHPFGDVVECYGKHQHRRLLQMTHGTFRLVAESMEMRNDVIKQQQKQHTHPKADGSGERTTASPSALLAPRQESAGSTRKPAVITPEAKPVNARCTFSFMLFFIKNTLAAPAEVPANGMKIPQNTFMSISSCIPLFLANEAKHRSQLLFFHESASLFQPFVRLFTKDTTDERKIQTVAR